MYLICPPKFGIRIGIRIVCLIHRESKIAVGSIGPLLRLGPNVIADGQMDLYYTWVQLLHLCLLHVILQPLNSKAQKATVYSYSPLSL